MTQNNHPNNHPSNPPNNHPAPPPAAGRQSARTPSASRSDFIITVYNGGGPSKIADALGLEKWGLLAALLESGFQGSELAYIKPATQCVSSTLTAVKPQEAVALLKELVGEARGKIAALGKEEVARFKPTVDELLKLLRQRCAATPPPPSPPPATPSPPPRPWANIVIKTFRRNTVMLGKCYFFFIIILCLLCYLLHL